MSFRERWNKRAAEARNKIQKNLQPTYIGIFIVRSQYQLPKIELPKKLKDVGETRSVEELFAEFYRLNMWTKILGEKCCRFSEKTDLMRRSYRAYAFLGYFTIKVTMGYRTNQHKVMLYYQDPFKHIHPLCAVFIEGNFYKTEEMRKAVINLIRIKEFRPSLGNYKTQLPY